MHAAAARRERLVRATSRTCPVRPVSATPAGAQHNASVASGTVRGAGCDAGVGWNDNEYGYLAGVLSIAPLSATGGMR